MHWFEIENSHEIDSPSVVLYEAHFMHNLSTMLNMVKGDVSRLMPHVKTHKMPEVVKRMLALGITRFKVSTLAEAEMVAFSGASTVLLAHQLVGPKISHLGKLIQKFPNVSFCVIADNAVTLGQLETEAGIRTKLLGVYIDINNGMDRSGIKPGTGMEQLTEAFSNYKNLVFKGFHVYDGHLRQPEYTYRKTEIENSLHTLEPYFRAAKKRYPEIELICGGTPSFSTHALYNDRVCSPGTCVFWDWGYSEKLAEQPFKWAVLLLTRVISKPAEGIVTIDLGHKAVAAENPIDQRVRFLNLETYTLLSQSEEHGVLKVENADALPIGTVLYGVPYHICPTINLHHHISVIRKGKKVTEWEILANRRKLTI
ncbi:D-TA family PLP-dependent enzyme [Ascidiimonas aurantiaca]|uniref:D-TA family PLP-dependent enzyme n=1 Tax=Ascidiimonas aurantiaca TaxID=1685432 RepID=UPI0030EC1BB4